MNGKVIETFDLTKAYKLKTGGKILALDNINLSINEGEIFGLLGPNGAGKTTLVSILSTLLQPTSGYAEIYGLNISKHGNAKKIKHKIGLMLGAEMVYFRMTGIDNLKFFSRLYRIKNSSQKIKDITTNLGIYNKLGEYVSSYSRGQKLRIALARVLLIEPEILFLDEPLLGLDPKTTRDLISILLKLNKTILLTSHQMHVVEQLCERIAFLNNGKVIKIDTQENYKKLISEFIRISFDIFEKDKKTELEKELNSLNYVKNISKRKDGFLITISDNKYYPDLLTNLGKYPVQRVQEIEPTLDDVFVELS